MNALVADLVADLVDRLGCLETLVEQFRQAGTMPPSRQQRRARGRR